MLPRRHIPKSPDRHVCRVRNCQMRLMTVNSVEASTERGEEEMKGEVVVDERGRTSLARVRSHDYERYMVEEFDDGTLVLTPAVTISALELAVLRDPALMAAI